MGILISEWFDLLEKKSGNLGFLCSCSLLEADFVLDKENLLHFYARLRKKLFQLPYALFLYWFAIQKKFGTPILFPEPSTNSQDPFDFLLSLNSDCDSSNLKFCVQCLKSEKEEIRCLAMEILFVCAKENSLPHWLHLICDNNPKVSAMAHFLILNTKKDTLFKALDFLLKNRDPHLRLNAIYTLSRLQSLDFVIKMLMEATKDPVLKIKTLAIRSLSSHPSPEVNTRLKELCNDADISVCETSEKVLGFLQSGKKRELYPVLGDFTDFWVFHTRNLIRNKPAYSEK